MEYPNDNENDASFKKRISKYINKSNDGIIIGKKIDVGIFSINK